MKKFKVVITETIHKVYEVSARNRAQALKIAEDAKPAKTKRGFCQSIY